MVSLNGEDKIFKGSECTFIGKFPLGTVPPYSYSHKNNKNHHL